MPEIDIVLERDTANDESAMIIAVRVPSGTAVAEDDLLFEFENSKATQELRAPQSGILIHSLAVGQSVAFGVPIARIAGAELGLAAPASPLAEAVVEAVQTAPPVRASAPRFSHEALRLLSEFGIARSAFTTGFVTSQQVKRRAGVAALPVRQPPAPPPSTNTAAEPVNHRKRAEILALSSGAGGTMLSVLGKTIGKLPIRRAAGDIFADRITDLVIYEAARLMKKYPKLNACYEDGGILQHAAIHAGIAIDSGGRLVVYGIENADRLDLGALSRVIADAVARYMNNTLTAPEMLRATFTVTDLSADALDFVFPLLPRGQSLILGVTRDSESAFRLFAGFDHRVTEGREVAAFLQELAARLLSFGTANAAQPVALCCDYCQKSMAEAVIRSGDKGLLSVVNGQGVQTLCCASCWNGW